MNIIKAKNYEEMSAKAAVIIGAGILEKPDCVLGFATGGTPVGTYAELVRMHKVGTLDFSEVKTYNLDEYYGNPPTDKNSYI
jgi:glucosamine-6-phosphate deaminase